MKSGEISQLRLNRDLQDYHSVDDCRGDWQLIFQDKVPYRLDSHIFLTIDKAPFVKCNSCGATFFAPGFEKWLVNKIAIDLISQQGMLPKSAIRFLRTLTGKTQKEIAEFLEVSQEEYNKFESVSNTTRQLNPDRQSRLKGIFADLLDVKDADVYRKAVYIRDGEMASVPKTIHADSFELESMHA